MLPPSSYYNIYYHILQYNKTKYLTKNYRLYAACRHFSYFGTVKDPITSFSAVTYVIDILFSLLLSGCYNEHAKSSLEMLLHNDLLIDKMGKEWEKEV